MNFPTQSDLFLAVDTLTEPEPSNPDYTDYMFMSFEQLMSLAQDDVRYAALSDESKDDLRLALLHYLRATNED